MEKIIGNLRASIRFIIFIIYLLIFLTSAFIVRYSSRDEFKRKRRTTRHGTWWCWLCCKTFGIKVTVKNPPSSDFTGLVVGNHMGFVDILACAATLSNLFVTSREMRETPVLGLITEMGGCVYVERRSRNNIEEELADLIKHLKMGFRITLYPEATSHNGEEILPFKRTLLSSAALADVPILPYCFNFTSINGEPFTLKYRDAVCYWGDLTFMDSLWQLGRLKEVCCEIEFLPLVHPDKEASRAAVADQIREMIVEKFKPVQPSV